MNTIRRRLSAAIAAGSMTAALSVTLLATSPAHADGAASCTDTSSKGGVISPCMMIARANNWIAAGAPYNQGGWYASPSGDGTYREDCAGFVAMAWHMQWSPPVTYSPPGLDDPSISKYLGTVSSLKSVGSLDTIQPGDALVLTGEHVVLFAGWTDSSHTSAVIDSESRPGVPTSQAGGINALGTQYLIDQGYKVYRYNNDQLNNPTSPPTTTVDSATVSSSAVTLTGTATPAADAFYFHVQQNGVDKLYSPAVAGTPGTPHHTWSFDPKSLPSGAYQVIASATLNGQIGSSAPYTITINNVAPPAAPTMTNSGAILHDTTALTATAPGASSVTYAVDGKAVGTSTSGPDFSLEWDSTQVGDGPHTITATAYNSGGSASSQGVTYSVENSAHAASVVDQSGTTSTFTRDASNGDVIDTSVTSAGVINVYDLTAHNGTPTTSGNPAAVVDSKGTISVLTRDPNGHLFDTSITSAGAINLYDWTASSATPAMAGDASAVLDPSGAVSIFTRSAANGDVIDSSITSAGALNVYDLTAHNGTPTTSGNPAAVVDSKGTISVLTRDPNGHLFDTSITSAGVINLYDWTASSATPAMAGDASAVLDPSGAVSIFTRSAANGDVIDSSITSAGALNVYDLTAHNGTPTTSGDPMAAVDSKGTISVLTRDPNGHLFDTSITSAGVINLYDWTATSGTPAMAGDASAVVDHSGTLSTFTTDASNGHVIDSSATATGVLNVYDLTAKNGTPAA
ncbi:hypothetical protein KGQ20_30470 [Catenulispora sp. NF23]|uniref:hypothetical protein n=1 Tax=Catenulispora pinistramenti TaxID=2705254 RepID=UPI001BABD828|nr:hypothetical protein [Catenulispora pinistramenti]MBS2537090.1 hypothetical protein [Catenulispora pinistramenti]